MCSERICGAAEQTFEITRMSWSRWKLEFRGGYVCD